MINGAIAQKLQNLDSILVELRSLGCLTIQELEQDWRTKRAVERSLQILVEIVIDICQRILSLNGHVPATTGRDAVERVVQMGILGRYDAYPKMVQFRNFVVHRYERLDNAILVDMVNRHLVDFECFRNEILAYIREPSMLIDWKPITPCLSNDRNIVAAWIFGSAREGIVRSGGDIDVGILFYEKPLLDELINLRVCLQTALVFDDIDLVVLNDASPILRFEAVSGQPVYVADKEDRAAFVSLTAREYEDELAQWHLKVAA